MNAQAKPPKPTFCEWCKNSVSHFEGCPDAPQKEPTFEDALETEAQSQHYRGGDPSFVHEDGVGNFKAGARWGRDYGAAEALACAEVLELREAAGKLANLEDDYQAEDTSGLHYAVQYWIEEKARRKARLYIALAAFEKLSGGGT